MPSSELLMPRIALRCRVTTLLYKTTPTAGMASRFDDEFHEMRHAFVIFMSRPLRYAYYEQILLTCYFTLHIYGLRRRRAAR